MPVETVFGTLGGAPGRFGATASRANKVGACGCCQVIASIHPIRLWLSANAARSDGGLYRNLDAAVRFKESGARVLRS